MISTLSLLRSDEQVKRWTLRTEELFRIGRAEENQARPQARGLSRFHTEVDFKLGHWIVRDLGSTNGTWINGKKAPPKSETPLKNGDRVSAGSAMFVYQQWEPKARVCPVCGDGELFDEAALVIPEFARPGVIVCVNCCCSMRETEEEAYDFLVTPAVFDKKGERGAGGPHTLSQLEALGEAVLDKLDQEHFKRHTAAKGDQTLAHKALNDLRSRDAKGKPAAPSKPQAPLPPAPPTAQPPAKSPPPPAEKPTHAKRNGLSITLPGLRVGKASSAAEALRVLEEAKRRERIPG